MLLILFIFLILLSQIFWHVFISSAKNIRFVTRLKKGAKWEDMEIEFTSLPGLRLRLATIHSGNDSYLTKDRDLGDHCYEQRWINKIRVFWIFLNKDLKYNRVKHGLFRPCLHGRKSNLQ